MPTPLARRVLLGASFSARRLFLMLFLLGSLGLTGTSFAQGLVGPPPQGFSAVAVSPASVVGGNSASGTVTITNPSLSDATVVSLSSSASAVTVSPSLLTVPAGDSSAAFSVTTTAVTAPLTVTITGTAGNVTKTATLTVNPAPAVPAYLSNLTLSSTSVAGGSGATGTVTLSSPAPADLLVTLLSNNGAATVPASCIIKAGATQASFSIATTAVSATADVTLSGSYNGWIQGDVLSVLPASLPPGLSFNMPPVHAAVGNGCTVVSWNRLPDGTVSGYNVYRTSGGTKTLLTATPFQGNFYPVTGLTNDTATCSYQVAAVDILGQEHALSAAVSVAPSSASATLNWTNPPSAVTDRLLMSAILSSGGQVFGTSFLIDGQLFGGGGSNSRYVNGVQTYTAGAGFDSTKLSNGPHTVQFFGFADSDQTLAGVTPPITIQVSNTISNDSIDNGWLDPSQGELCFVSATAPAGSTWTVQVTSADGSHILRTWQGASSLVKLAWDGKDASGKILPIDDYAILFTVQPPDAASQAATPSSTNSASPTPNAAGVVVKKNHPTKLVQGQPIALALISVGASYYLDSNGTPVATLAQDIMLANVLTNAYTTLFGAGNFQIIRSDTFDPDQVATKNRTKLQQLEGWMGIARVFYLFGHGAGTQGPPGPVQTPRSTVFGAYDWNQGYHLELFPTTAVAFDLKGYDVLVPKYVQNHNYVFAWIDACNSAGGDSTTGQTGTPDYVWAQAFNATTFIGNNGFTIVNNIGPTATSNWYKWRNTFWTDLAKGQNTNQTYDTAYSHLLRDYNTHGHNWAGPSGYPSDVVVTDWLTGSAF